MTFLEPDFWVNNYTQSYNAYLAILDLHLSWAISMILQTKRPLTSWTESLKVVNMSQAEPQIMEITIWTHATIFREDPRVVQIKKCCQNYGVFLKKIIVLVLFIGMCLPYSPFSHYKKVYFGKYYKCKSHWTQEHLLKTLVLNLGCFCLYYTLPLKFMFLSTYGCWISVVNPSNIKAKIWLRSEERNYIVRNANDPKSPTMRRLQI